MLILLELEVAVVDVVVRGTATVEPGEEEEGAVTVIITMPNQAAEIAAILEKRWKSLRHCTSKCVRQKGNALNCARS